MIVFFFISLLFFLFFEDMVSFFLFLVNVYSRSVKWVVLRVVYFGLLWIIFDWYRGLVVLVEVLGYRLWLEFVNLGVLGRLVILEEGD